MTDWLSTTPVAADRDKQDRWNRTDWFLLGAGIVVWCLIIPFLLWKVS